MTASTARHETRALLRAHLAAASGYRHLTRHCPICHRLMRLAMEPVGPVRPLIIRTPPPAPPTPPRPPEAPAERTGRPPGDVSGDSAPIGRSDSAERSRSSGEPAGPRGHAGATGPAGPTEKRLDGVTRVT
ncbi:DUF6274 family protein [Streptomyces sp. AM 4-1-1]|uniref:DUF6274 family protein n=1 Tax=Streptomyces sp. AM 4-1-1 TaxID=3028710 RepID=UPI0023B947A3|nr:DUF6274 family protein [Streptomyces sp. AM 4-1-1]WEH34364.1 DUF6274 family protein [Streptomyces sp. AM 4-1-1]